MPPSVQLVHGTKAQPRSGKGLAEAGQRIRRLAAWTVAAGLGCFLVHLALRLLIAGPGRTPMCQPAPPGFNTVFCGRDLMAVVGNETRSLVRVLDAHWGDNQFGFTQTAIDVETHESRLLYAKAMADMVLAEEQGWKRDGKGARRVLVLGLGGGAIPHLLYHFCSVCHVTGVDLTQDALHIARTFVQPDDGSRIVYVHANAEHFIARTAADSFDVVLMDAFKGADPSAPMQSAAAASDVYTLLRGGGLYAINVFTVGNDGHVEGALDTLEGVFGQGNVGSEVVMRGGDAASVLVYGRKPSVKGL